MFEKYRIDEVYNLAAQSFVHSSFQNPVETSLVNALGVLNLLEIIRNKKNNIKFYQASTSEMFGESGSNNQNEKLYFIQEVHMQLQKLLHIILFKIIEKHINYML